MRGFNYIICPKIFLFIFIFFRLSGEMFSHQYVIGLYGNKRLGVMFNHYTLINLGDLTNFNGDKLFQKDYISAKKKFSELVNKANFDKVIEAKIEGLNISRVIDPVIVMDVFSRSVGASH